MQMKQYPREVQHVLVLSAIPMLYPGFGVLETLLNAVNNYPVRLLFKTGAYLPPPLMCTICTTAELASW